MCNYLFQDMDLIEVLWKQDVDLGFSLDMANGKLDKPEPDEVQNDTVSTHTGPTTSISIENDDDLEKLKTLKAINAENIKVSAQIYFYTLMITEQKQIS